MASGRPWLTIVVALMASIARHVRFSCERREDVRTWSCGGNWRMLRQVQRADSATGQCSATLMGLNAGTVAEDQVILDVVDFFGAAARASLEVEGCGSIGAETLCRLSHISPGTSWGSRDVAADFDVLLYRSTSSGYEVKVDRHCTGVGPCLLEVKGCRAFAAN